MPHRPKAVTPAAQLLTSQTHPPLEHLRPRDLPPHPVPFSPVGSQEAGPPKGSCGLTERAQEVSSQRGPCGHLQVPRAFCPFLPACPTCF